jgi:glycerol-3-phosphate O-acyltransferase
MLLLGSSPRALTRHEMAIEIREVVLWANARNIRITHHFEIENEAELAAMAQVLVNNGMLTRYDDGPEEVYAIAPKQHAVANYYRNTTIHHFVTKAIAELALLRASTEQHAPLQAFWQEVDRLRDLFKFEFFYAPREEFHNEVGEELRRYALDWEDKLAQEAEYASWLLREFRPLVAHAALTQFVEAHYVVADVAAITPPEIALDPDDCLRRCFAYGKEAYLRRRISSEASIGKQLFENGYKWIENQGLAGAGDAELTARRVQTSQSLRELMHRLEQIKALALPV